MAENFFLPQFNVYSQRGGCHIVSAKKQIGSISSHYPISISQENFGKMQNKYIGKVRALSSGNIYNIFDDGVSLNTIDESPEKSHQRRQILATVIIFNGEKGKSPEIEVFLLKEGVSYTSLLMNKRKEVGLNRLFSLKSNWENISIFRTRRAEWISDSP